MATETITLGGGCFWCIEAVFEEVRGVKSVMSGYAGGEVRNPTYRQVCGGQTGHAEVVRVTFDPAVISLRDVLGIFFTVHDPTTKDRQGADVGTQYRSAVYWHSSDQELVVREVIRELQDEGVYADPVVTEVAPVGDFYEAEPEHHSYYRRNPNAGYCRAVISPKVAKFRQKYGQFMQQGA